MIIQDINIYNQTLCYEGIPGHLFYLWGAIEFDSICGSEASDLDIQRCFFKTINTFREFVELHIYNKNYIVFWIFVPTLLIQTAFGLYIMSKKKLNKHPYNFYAIVLLQFSLCKWQQGVAELFQFNEFFIQEIFMFPYQYADNS